MTYADAFASQPFGNTLVTLTMTGAQLKQLRGGMGPAASCMMGPGGMPLGMMDR